MTDDVLPLDLAAFIVDFVTGDLTLSEILEINNAINHNMDVTQLSLFPKIRSLFNNGQMDNTMYHAFASIVHQRLIREEMLQRVILQHIE